MDAPYCVTVAGSVDLTWAHQSFIRAQLNRFATKMSVLIHGESEGRSVEAPGCDELAADAAESLHMWVHGVPPLVELFGENAGAIRDKLLTAILVAYAAGGYRPVFLAFPNKDPRDLVTWSVIDLVTKLRDEGFPVEIRVFEL